MHILCREGDETMPTNGLRYLRRVAALLDEGRNYLEVSEETGASSATISRVNRCLNYGIGYRKTLDNLKKESIVNEDGSDLEK